jgi:DNA ligase-associated metallophosphoesterase
VTTGSIQTPALPGAISIAIAGERLVLLPTRTLWWPAARTLLVADVHLGKCEAMRAHGAPLPAGVHTAQLERLALATKLTGAARILVLGDLLHAPAGMTSAMIDDVAAWRAGLQASVQVVPGNHDRRLERIADAWKLDVLEVEHVEGPFRFVHEPSMATDKYTWAGHIHPAVTLRSTSDRLKLPCFHIGTKLGVLPAFSSFTAGGPFARERGDRVYAIAEGSVIEV